jgi:hypothetical protein
MDFNATIDIIIKDLNEAREIIDDLRRYPGVPALQIELAKSKCKSAGDVIALLKNIKNNSTAESLTDVIPGDSEEKKERITDQIDEIPQAEKKKEETQSGKKPTESVIIADKFSHLSSRFNERLSSLKSEDEVPDIVKSKPLTNLSDAIGINDKFLFIREIFNGNKEAYGKVLTELEHIQNLSDAKALIMSHKGDNEENEAVRQLLDLVKRKLPQHE